MKRFNTTVLLDQLMSDTREIILTAEKIGRLDKGFLQKQPLPGKWSIAQILAHLNFYSRFYLDAIEKKLHRNQTKPEPFYRPGWLGDYFTKMMKPSAGKVIKNKMKALKAATPPSDIDAEAAVRQFIADQHRLLNLLEIASSADISKLRIPTSVTSLITLKLGDAFRFFIAHEQRHMVQILNVLDTIPLNSETMH